MASLVMYGLSQISVVAEETETDSNCDGKINNRYTVRCPVILMGDSEKEEDNAETSGSKNCYQRLLILQYCNI